MTMIPYRTLIRCIGLQQHLFRRDIPDDFFRSPGIGKQHAGPKGKKTACFQIFPGCLKRPAETVQDRLHMVLFQDVLRILDRFAAVDIDRQSQLLR